MQISNNYQLNFRAGRIDADGLKVLRSRLPEEQIQKFVDRFKSRHSDPQYNIVLGKDPITENGLDAMIMYGKAHFRYMEESIISSCFNPKIFMKKINRQIDKDVISIAKNGYIS